MLDKGLCLRHCHEICATTYHWDTKNHCEVPQWVIMSKKRLCKNKDSEPLATLPQLKTAHCIVLVEKLESWELRNQHA